MIYVYACAEASLGDAIRSDLMKLSVKYPGADYEYWQSSVLKTWEKRLSETSLADVIFCELSEEDGIRALKSVRTRHRDAKIIPVTDASISPTAYVNPEIMPFTLIWKPVSEEPRYSAVESVVKTFLGNDSAECFVLETRWDVQRIPYDKILYFEAREKKVFIRLQDMELPLNGTLSGLEEKLPGSFIRCHKSIVVNRIHIERMDAAANLLELPGGILLPVSRKLKKAVREAMEQNAG